MTESNNELNCKDKVEDHYAPILCAHDPNISCTLAKDANENQIKYNRILEYSFEEIYVFDAKTLLFLEVSKGALTNLDYTLAEMKKLAPNDIKPSMSAEQFNELIEPLCNGTVEIVRFSTAHRRKDGSFYDTDVRLQYVGGDHPVFISMVTDVTERNEYEAELKALAFRDPGTNLYNRRYFLEQLEGIIHNANRHNSTVGLLLIDMDNFSKINNTYGHILGDKIIVEFSKKINSVFSRKTDIVARYGGDEFVVMCLNNKVDDLLKKCEELKKLFNDPYMHKGNVIIQTASIGICIRTGNGYTITAEKLIAGADIAMYRVKEMGKNAAQVCKDESM